VTSGNQDSVRTDAESSVHAAPEQSIRPELVEGPSGDAERLASGFAEHVVRWAKRTTVVIPGKEVVIPAKDVVIPGLTRDPAGHETLSSARDKLNLEILRRCAHATSLATSDGHVCVLLSELAESSPSPAAGGQGWGQPLDVHSLRTTLLQSRVVGTPAHPASLPLILDEDNRLYLHRYFDYEVRLARRLMQAAQTRPRQVTPAARDLLNSLFPPAPDNGVDWQKIAAAMALRGSLTVISGGPGTGKTTTVVNLLACLLTQEPHTRIALAAPTGKAAARMTEAIRQRADHLPPELRAKLPQESFTIHRLLGANPGQGRFTHDANNQLAIDTLIVDEASMLDLALATRLLEAVPATARIILLGDKDQLAAVEAGAVFAELSADPTLTDECRREVAQLCGYQHERIAPPAPAQASPLHDAAVWLTKNYRFPADSAIGKLARYINEGRANEALALLRGSRVEHSGTSGTALSRFALSSARPELVEGSKSSNAEAPPKSKAAKKSNEDTASLSLFPELEAAGAPAATADSSPAQDHDTSIQWLDAEQRDNVLDAVLAGYANFFDTLRRDPTDVHAIGGAFAQFRVLCAVREGPSGVNAVNAQLARHAGRTLPAVGEAHSMDNRSPWYLGRPVMVLHNDYVHRLFNGDIGVALPDAAGELTVFFPDGEDGYRAVPPVRMPQHETAFAMTVHKAQGSECDGVLVLLPQQRSRVVTRELLYTAVTRARSRVTVSGSADVLAAAIESRSRRHSGLLARLHQAAMSRK
jgi:exodeoxyribonuclease V alpha subunit